MFHIASDEGAQTQLVHFKFLQVFELWFFLFLTSVAVLFSQFLKCKDFGDVKV